MVTSDLDDIVFTEVTDDSIKEAGKSETSDPSPKSRRQISGSDSQGNFMLSGFVKVAYQIDHSGRCHSREEIPLRTDIEIDPDNNWLLLADADVYVQKPLTDVVIKGYAYPPHIQMRQFDCEFWLGSSYQKLSIIGDRKAYLNTSGDILFTTPETIEQIPLRYSHAYGGIDKVGEKKIEIPPKELLASLPPEFDPLAGNPYRYPRNPGGTGYVIEKSKEGFENLGLPNLEDPANLLTPSTLLTERIENWISMPIPVATDWVDPSWFPRVTYLGILPDHVQPDSVIPEISRGWANHDLISIERAYTNLQDARFANGASPGFQVPHMEGHESLRMTNVCKAMKDWKFTLPGEVPTIKIDGREGRMINTSPVLQTVEIYPDDLKIHLVWRGTGPARRPYLPDELEKMPLSISW